MDDLRTVLLRCIIHYNTRRKLKNLKYTSEMIAQGIKPIPSELWNYGRKQDSANLISVDQESFKLTLLTRTTGKFSRKGFLVKAFDSGKTISFGLDMLIDHGLIKII